MTAGRLRSRALILEESASKRTPLAWIRQHAVGLVAVAVVMMRLPLLNKPLGLDEAGYLMVGGQWHLGGPTGATSLYGSYWVDRPPLLVSIYGVAAGLGGAVPLRLIGCLAAALVVLGVAHVARRMSGGSPRGAVGAAVVAAALCVDPLIGPFDVNGELLAAPFVVWGIAGVLACVTRTSGPARRSALTALGAGAAMVAAVLVKQNMIDVAVFAAVALAVSTARHELTVREAGRIVGWFAAGTAASLVALAGWTVAHGTSLSGVYDAMYPFRLAADRVMTASSDTKRIGRMWHLIRVWVVCGEALVMAVMGWALVTHRLRGTAVWAIVLTLVYDVASVVLSRNYYPHYLLQLVVPVAVAVGLLLEGHCLGRYEATGRESWSPRLLVAAVAAVAVVTWGNFLPGPASAPASVVGAAIEQVSQPGDTIVTVYGHGAVSEASGLPSPYPYLWHLPMKVRDPRLQLLDRVLAGRRAPTWFVTWSHLSVWGGDTTRTARLLARDYHRIADLDGHRIYLHDGLDRVPPRPAALEGSV